MRLPWYQDEYPFFTRKVKCSYCYILPHYERRAVAKAAIDTGVAQVSLNLADIAIDGKTNKFWGAS
jgi:hypothetical protein